jgi:hypothetical protein
VAENYSELLSRFVFDNRGEETLKQNSLREIFTHELLRAMHFTHLLPTHLRGFALAQKTPGCSPGLCCL